MATELDKIDRVNGTWQLFCVHFVTVQRKYVFEIWYFRFALQYADVSFNSHMSYIFVSIVSSHLDE